MARKKQTDDNEIILNRHVEAAVDIAQDMPGMNDIGFLPAGLCHTFLPYTDPGDDVKLWYREQGNYILSVASVPRLNPDTKEVESFGIPYGPKPRLLLAVLNTLALKTKSAELHLGNSLTEFIGDFLKLSTDGRTIRGVKSQMAKLAASDVQISYRLGEGHTIEEGMKIIRGLDLWWTKDKNQRHLWGNYLRFSDDYFNMLQEHGVPLDMRALQVLSNKPMAIDLYSFLAHRLHSLGKPITVSWQAMKDQFGFSYERMDHFKHDFRKCLDLVKPLYPDARIEEVYNKGFTLAPSKPAVPGKTQLVIPHFSFDANQALAQLPKRKKDRGISKAELRQIRKEAEDREQQRRAAMTPAQREREDASNKVAMDKLIEKRRQKNKGA